MVASPPLAGFSTARAFAEELDAADPLAPLRAHFIHDDPDLIYLDGNSLGRLSEPTLARIAHVVREEWGRGLVRSWSRWISWPTRIGDLLGTHLLGAAPGQVAIADSTTVNLYQLAAAALEARPDRPVIITDDDNFPTDRYVLEGLAARHGRRLRLIHTDPDEGIDLDALAAALDTDTALVSLSHVSFGSGALADMAAVNRLVHEAGALMLWDLCHSVGAVPIELDASGADLAVGCTYKYLNAGPGAPAFIYVRRDLHTTLRQPIWGWFGQRDQFALGPRYDPAPGIAGFLAGTPNVIGLAAVEEGVRILAAAGVGPLRAKGVTLTEYLIALTDAWLAPLGFRLASPRDPNRRGSHVSLRHPQAWPITQALIERGRVIPDFRAPDRLRLGPAPLTTRFVDVYDALRRLAKLVEAGAHAAYPAVPARVT